MSLISVRGLSLTFPNGKRALDRIDLDFRAGEFCVLAGPNGSGKTMLMRHLNGLMKAQEGQVLLEGKPIHDDLATVRERVGLVFQDADAQIVGQTVAADTAFGPENLRLNRTEIEERVTKALKATGLVGMDQRRPHTLSGGEKRRLAVAGVLAMEPDLLVLDEPFTGLDWPGSGDLIRVLDRLHEDGTTLLVITHDLDKILAHANRLIVMDQGRIVADGDPEDVIDAVENHGIRRPEGPVHGMTWETRE